MLEQAKAKLTAEMDQNKDNSYIQVVGKFLLNHLETHPGSAERILAPDKTIGKSSDAMRKEAEKKKNGNCAVLSDEEGFAVVLQYFGIEVGAAAIPTQSAPEPKKDNFDVKLEDLLPKG